MPDRVADGFGACGLRRDFRQAVQQPGFQRVEQDLCFRLVDLQPPFGVAAAESGFDGINGAKPLPGFSRNWAGSALVDFKEFATSVCQARRRAHRDAGTIALRQPVVPDKGIKLQHAGEAR